MSEEPAVRVVGEDEDRTVTIDNDILSIGRAKDNDLVLEESMCSRSHCRIEKMNHGYKLVDLESRNGTKVNGHFTNQHILKDADRIEIGRTLLIFQHPDEEKQKQETDNPSPEETPVGNSRDKSSSTQRGPTVKKKKKSSSSSRSRSRSSDISTSTLVLLLIVGVMVVLGLVLLANRENPSVVRSRRSYQRGVSYMQKGQFEKALNNLENVSSNATPGLHRKAKEKMKRARAELKKRKRNAKLADARQQLDQLEMELKNQNSADHEKIERRITEFREKMTSRFPPEERNHPAVQGFFDRIRSVEERVFKESAAGMSFKWKKKKEDLNRLLNNEQFGKAANELEKFLESYGDSDEGSKARRWKNHLKFQARAFLDRTIEETLELQKKGNSREALSLMNSVLRKLKPARDGILSSVYSRAQERKRDLQEFLDSD